MVLVLTSETMYFWVPQAGETEPDSDAPGHHGSNCHDPQSS